MYMCMLNTKTLRSGGYSVYRRTDMMGDDMDDVDDKYAFLSVFQRFMSGSSDIPHVHMVYECAPLC